MKNIFGLIPARGGSKGLPNKNLAELCGFPMINYTISAARKSRFVENIFVSSNDPKILQCAKSQGVGTLKRPNKFSTDNSSPIDVVKHFSNYLKNKNLHSDAIICYLQPSSPLRTEFHIDEAFELLKKTDQTTLISVSETINIPFKMFTIQNGKLRSLFDEKMSNMRRQDLPKTYIVNGAIYIFPLVLFEKHNTFPSNGSVPYLMKKEESIDVDNENDLKAVKNIMLQNIKKYDLSRI